MTMTIAMVLVDNKSNDKSPPHELASAESEAPVDGDTMRTPIDFVHVGDCLAGFISCLGQPSPATCRRSPRLYSRSHDYQHRSSNKLHDWQSGLRINTRGKINKRQCSQTRSLAEISQTRFQYNVKLQANDRKDPCVNKRRMDGNQMVFACVTKSLTSVTCNADHI
ncbi:hypothetical protein BGW36DRAFT_10747 [Talaromyces proteolyticus]|uniref:Uncharacterized protein n=1 Tax=Talaromyces proteolyticus TaxID=1131652 RepID=A0AAD4Q162_9EURO|nr:uncharacterized protein BGW36DRAFT_10747 [Talaromyces proteolyticus]KAH8705280.1 hypothetical protein BGW36DRAFT_10747 [Talaromyces proteolyticus]